MARTSWDATAQAMAELIAEADQSLRTGTVVAVQPAANTPSHESAPLHLADAAQAVSVVGPSATPKRASAG